MKATFELEQDVSEALTVHIAKSMIENPWKKITKNEVVNKALRKYLGVKK